MLHLTVNFHSTKQNILRESSAWLLNHTEKESYHLTPSRILSMQKSPALINTWWEFPFDRKYQFELADGPRAIYIVDFI